MNAFGGLVAVIVAVACSPSPRTSSRSPQPASVPTRAAVEGDAGALSGDAGSAAAPVAQPSSDSPRPGERLCVKRRAKLDDRPPVMEDEYVDAEGRVVLIVQRGDDPPHRARRPFVRIDHDAQGRLIGIERDRSGMGHLDLDVRYAYDGDTPFITEAVERVDDGRGTRRHTYDYQGRRLTSVAVVPQDLDAWLTQAIRLPGDVLPFSGELRVRSERSPVQIIVDYDKKGRVSAWKAVDVSGQRPNEITAARAKHDAQGRILELTRDVAGYGRTVVTNTWTDGRLVEWRIVTPHKTERRVATYDEAGRLLKTVTYSPGGTVIGEETVEYSCP